jgi:hypothetical protein
MSETVDKADAWDMLVQRSAKFRDARTKIITQEAEIVRLRARLEIDPRHPYDGIDCRDETIRGQDAEIERFKATLSHLTSASLAVLSASNGISDNEWKTPEGVYIPDFPVEGYGSLLDALNKAAVEARAIIEVAAPTSA